MTSADDSLTLQLNKMADLSLERQVGLLIFYKLVTINILERPLMADVPIKIQVGHLELKRKEDHQRIVVRDELAVCISLCHCLVLRA